MRLRAVLSVLLASGCGFEAVDECFPNCVVAPAPRDGGGSVDAGSRDAGSVDAGPVDVDAGPSDAGSVDIDAGPNDGGAVDAGSVDVDGGPVDAGPVDAGPVDAGAMDAGAMDAGCLGILRPYTSSGRDVIHVEGLAGSLGTVDYTISGYSAGSWGYTGMQRFTGRIVASPGAPMIQDTGLWVWADAAGVRTGFDYVGDNVNQNNTATPFINFRISPGISCGPGLGEGTFRFSSFRGPMSSGNDPIEGFYEFRCPSGGLDVRGCFHYSP